MTERTPAEASRRPARLSHCGWFRKTETQLPRGREGERGEARGGWGQGALLCAFCTYSTQSC